MIARIYFAILFFFMLSCKENYTPKPRAFFKLDLPNKKYKIIESNCGFTFKIPIYSSLEKLNKDCFYNVVFPNQNATLHITYIKLANNLLDHSEQSRDLAYKHSIFADAISEQLYVNHKHNVYSVLYDFEGATATSTQFYITDSLNHFFRGALYFNTEISDSLLPVNNYLKEDIRQLIQSFKWTNQ